MEIVAASSPGLSLFGGEKVEGRAVARIARYHPPHPTQGQRYHTFSLPKLAQKLGVRAAYRIDRHFFVVERSTVCAKAYICIQIKKTCGGAWRGGVSPVFDGSK